MIRPRDRPSRCEQIHHSNIYQDFLLSLCPSLSLLQFVCFFWTCPRISFVFRILCVRLLHCLPVYLVPGTKYLVYTSTIVQQCSLVSLQFELHYLCLEFVTTGLVPVYRTSPLLHCTVREAGVLALVTYSSFLRKGVFHTTVCSA